MLFQPNFFRIGGGGYGSFRIKDGRFLNEFVWPHYVPAAHEHVVSFRIAGSELS